MVLQSPVLGSSHQSLLSPLGVSGVGSRPVSPQRRSCGGGGGWGGGGWGFLVARLFWGLGLGGFRMQSHRGLGGNIAGLKANYPQGRIH